MPNLRDIGRRVRQRLRTATGQHFFGRISAVTETAGRGNQFFAPRHILNVYPEGTVVTSGTVILDTAGRRLLCSWNGVGEAQGSYCETFKLYLLDRFISWTRAETVEDPVTGLDRQTVQSEIGPVWCAMEPAGQESDQLRVSVNKYRVLTNADLRVGDRLNSGLTVRSVNTSLGITIAEVW